MLLQHVSWCRPALSKAIAYVVGPSRLRLHDTARRWNSEAPGRRSSELSKLLTSSGLGRFGPDLNSHNLQDLQRLMVTDRDALYDILIDAGMRTADRKTFLKTLQKERLHEETTAAASPPIPLNLASRSTVSYVLSPSFFLGRWALEREIWRTSEGSGVVATCQGLASISEEGYDQEVSTGSETRKWLYYQESGEQVLSADPAHGLQPQRGTFRASYIYQHSLMQDRLDLFFDRARGSGPQQSDLFCSFNLTSAEFGVALKSTSHLCGGDQYDGEFLLFDTDTWKLRYNVTGPRKAFAIDTKYCRQAHSVIEKKTLPGFW